MEFSEFQQIPAGEIFRVVITKYHTIERINGQWPELMFVCKKGRGHDDWAIYCHYPEKGVRWIAEEGGNKVTTDRNILSIFPCDEETLKHYRR